MYGQLIPVGGGKPISLSKTSLLVGRREGCDIVLRFSNVSADHCWLTLTGGYWYVRDLDSRNGIRVNGVRVREKRLSPGDVLRIAKHAYQVNYVLSDLDAAGPPAVEPRASDGFGKSLLEKAGFEPGQTANMPLPPEFEEPLRYEIIQDKPGQRRLNHDGPRD